MTVVGELPVSGTGAASLWSRLLVYHFMFGYGARLTDERRGCTGCSLVADHFDGVIPHLNGRDITLVCASIAPLQELQDYKRQMGWRFPWVSSLGSDFNYDFGVAFNEEQQRNGADYNFQHVDKPEPQKEGMSAFALQDGAVHHTYSTYARGVEALMGTYQFLDLAPWGRNEDGLEFAQAWWRRHDEYGLPRAPNPSLASNAASRTAPAGLATATEHPALIPQEVAGSSRQSPAIPATPESKDPAHGRNPAHPRAARKRQDRPVTPQVAGSSHVAPVEAPASPPFVSSRSCAPSQRRLLRLGLVFVVTVPPGPWGFLVATQRRQVENPEGPHQLLDSAVVGGVGVVHDPVLECERAQPLSLRQGLINVAEVVLGAVSLLLLGEGGTEVVLEVAAEGGDPGKAPAHPLLVEPELLQGSDRLGHQGHIVAVEVGHDAVEVISHEGAAGASGVLLVDPEPEAEHEVVDEQLGAAVE
jgi:predicted dithiol-disulfide oxidoreductase (DUF899 family)